MGNDTASGRVLVTALDRLKHIQVVQHILDAAVIGQSVEERPHCLFGLHPVIVLTTNALLLPPVYRKQPPRSGPSTQTVLLHANYYSVREYTEQRSAPNAAARRPPFVREF